MHFRKNTGKEAERQNQPIWSVMRQDDNGSHAAVAQNLTHRAAEEMVRELEASGHKQFYWIVSQVEGE